MIPSDCPFPVLRYHSLNMHYHVYNCASCLYLSIQKTRMLANVIMSLMLISNFLGLWQGSPACKLAILFPPSIYLGLFKIQTHTRIVLLNVFLKNYVICLLVFII